MAFDAGSIIARLDLDDADFDRKLRADVAKIEAFEKEHHGVRITASPAEGDLASARRMFSNLDRQLTTDAAQRMRSGSGSVLGSLMGLTASRVSAMPAPAMTAIGRTLTSLGGGAGGVASGVAGGAGPSILGLPALGLAGLAGGGALLGALPAATGVAAGAGVLGIGAAALLMTSKTLQAQAKSMLGSLEQTMARAAAPLIRPLQQAFGQIPAFFRQIRPELTSLFSAAAPLLRPLLGGIESLVRSLLPGLVSLLRASGPAMAVFAQILGTLGRDLSGMFRAFASAIGPSSILLRALLDAIGGLLPVIGQLAALFAKALAPVVVAFAASFRALMPALLIFGRVAADLAQAVLGDLAGALRAVAMLLGAIAPSLSVLAGVIGRTFAILENSGVFGVLSDALEQLAAPLGLLVSTIIRQLVPVLPTVITLFAQMSSVLIALSAAGLGYVLRLVTELLAKFPFLVPVLGLAGAAFLAFNVIAAANPIGAVIIAVSALIGAVVLLTTHWRQAWGDITNWAKDAWEFLTHGWGQALVPGLTLIRLAVDFLRDHWRGAWDDISNAAQAAWGFIYRNIVSPMETIFTRDLPGAFSTAVSAIKRIWGDVENAVLLPVRFVINDVLDGLISLFDRITGAIGLSKLHISPLTLAAGGRITQGSGPAADDVLARVSRGETVVSAADSAMLAPLFTAIGIPGYATGGVPAGLGLQRATAATGPGIVGKVADIGKIAVAILTGNATAAASALYDMSGHPGAGGAAGDLAQILLRMPADVISGFIRWAIGQASALGSYGNAIVAKAESFAGRVPYVWGGDTPAGWDCSGFVKWIYDFFGINPPRTSEQQFSWARRVPSPVPGGLAFFAGADGTASSPGHVGIVVNGTTMVDAFGTGFGTRFDRLSGSSGALAGYGVPPSGVGILPGAAGGLGAGGDVIQWLKMAMSDTFAPAGWLPALETLVGKESGGSPTAVNPITVNGEHASGLFQTLPSTYAAYATVPGGIFNPVSDAVAGIRYIMARYGSPYNIPGLMSGNYQGYDAGGWLMPGGPPGVNLSGQPELVLSPGQSRAYAIGAASGPDIGRKLDRIASLLASGQVGITIQLPEGTSVAQALSDLTFRMRVTDQQALTGAGLRPAG
jgi:phage-related protein